MTLQGKGGVGKSYVSALIAQYKQAQGHAVTCVDTDPVNSSFSQYQPFAARRLDLMDGSRVNERQFDTLMEWLFTEEGDFIVDNGASCFIPLSTYLIENQAIHLLAEADRQVVVHCVITGGQAMLDTLTGLNRLGEQLPPQTGVIVWLNEFFGDIVNDGRGFEEMKAYKAHRQRIRGLVRLPRQNSDTFGKDVELMLNSKLTFDEAITSDAFQLMAKQRLKMVKRHLFEQMAVVGL